MLPPELASQFPKLVADGACKTSEATRQYNCIAWSAARDKNRWWQPVIEEAWDYWPPGVPDDCSFESFVILFETLGYEKCDGHDLEILYEKVVLYADAMGFTHVASQLCSGAWTSKLGPLEDIRHNTLEALEGNYGYEYGHARQTLRKRCGFLGIISRSVAKFWGIVSPFKSPTPNAKIQIRREYTARSAEGF
jgi:hypothetical protein